MTLPIQRLLAIMARLRNPVTGCEWDRAQTSASIAPYTIEEAYEVVDAINRNNIHDLKEELGDLLLQVVFHSKMAEENRHFSFDDVAEAICNKLEARHPHIFGDAKQDSARQFEGWESLKQAERTAKGAKSAMDGVALALPALLRAEKLQKRAARTGFDWPDATGAAEKLIEELAELAEASVADQATEAGDLLFSAANVVRSYGISPEEAMSLANAKFERRFRMMEELAEKSGENFPELSLERQEEYWQAVKRTEQS